MLNDPGVAALLAARFVPIALDNVENPNLTGGEKEFLRGKGLEFCTQGMSAFTAGGRVLEMGGGYEPGPVKRMLERALGKYRPGEDAQVKLEPSTEAERASLLRPPAGGLVLFVTWKALGGYDATQPSSTTGDGGYDAVFRRAIGADRLWVRRDEVEALAGGRFPESLMRRAARYHLSYVASSEVKDFEIGLEGGRAAGSFTPASGEKGRLAGFVAAKDGKVARFDLLALAWGRRIEDCGFAASLTVVPKGRRVPVAVLFTLADPADELARVPPHRSKEERYLR